MNQFWLYARRSPMVAGLLLLGTGLWGGLFRLGLVDLPVIPEIHLYHGMIMVGGFLGTLIGFERAVALDWRWPFFVPVSCVLGTAWLISGGEPFWGGVLITLGSLAMIGVFGRLFFLQPTDHGMGLTVASVCWVVGNGLWLSGMPSFHYVYWWMGFLVLTIAAERLELNRLLKLTGWKRWSYFLAFYGFVVGLLVRFAWPAPGLMITGLCFVALGLWLAWFDLARHTLFQGGDQGYSAICMYAGYLWIIVGGGLLFFFPLAQAGFYYDAQLHAVFLGFVFSMIFGHALIIFPNVIGRSIPFHPMLYLPLLILHGGLVIRLAGDLFHLMDGRIWGGIANVTAILLFFLMVMFQVLFGGKEMEPKGPIRR